MATFSSTAIAVGAHELPQELGDFAVRLSIKSNQFRKNLLPSSSPNSPQLLVESGFPMWQALLLNLGASLSALIGVCVGVAAGSESEEAQQYLLAFAAGGFLYIALASTYSFVVSMSVSGSQLQACFPP